VVSGTSIQSRIREKQERPPLLADCGSVLLTATLHTLLTCAQVPLLPLRSPTSVRGSKPFHAVAPPTNGSKPLPSWARAREQSFWVSSSSVRIWGRGSSTNLLYASSRSGSSNRVASSVYRYVTAQVLSKFWGSSGEIIKRWERLSLCERIATSSKRSVMFAYGFWRWELLDSGWGYGDQGLRVWEMRVNWTFRVSRLIWRCRQRAVVLELGQRGFASMFGRSLPLPWKLIASWSRSLAVTRWQCFGIPRT
jgi:hypothetical protein